MNNNTLNNKSEKNFMWDLKHSNALPGSRNLLGFIQMQPCPQQLENVMQFDSLRVALSENSSPNIKASFAKADPNLQNCVAWDSFTSPQIECEFHRTRDLVVYSSVSPEPSSVPGTLHVLIMGCWVPLLPLQLRKFISFSRPTIQFTDLSFVPTLSQHNSR